MAFPNIKPTTRSFTMGDYPSKTYRSLSGTIFKRAFGNKQTGYTLNLTFKNIGDAFGGNQTGELRKNSGTAKQIIDHYNDVDGTFSSFTLPVRVFEGMDNDFRDLIRSPSNIKWRYAGPPQVQSVKSGVSTVIVTLIGELDA
jgi:hypothetical protein